MPALLRASLLLLITGSLLRGAPPRPADRPQHRAPVAVTTQYEAGGSRWLDSQHQELVHFVCEPGASYVVSLNSASLLFAGVGLEDQPAFLEALREAVADWRAVLRCPRIRVEMDSPDADTRVLFAFIDTPGTLAVGTRAEDIVLNASRRWFPGSKQQGNYDRRGRAVSFYWVTAHELGHVWGLAHSDRPTSLMYATQCDTCRWSSFEQAGGNVIHAAGLVPDWSRPHYANRFFVKTPLAVIQRLLTGELPDEPLWSALAEQCAGETCTTRIDPAPPVAGTDDKTPVPRSSLLGHDTLRHLRQTDLRTSGGAPRLARAPVHGRSVPRPAPTFPGNGSRATLIPVALVPRPGQTWSDAWVARLPSCCC